jgi:hypothetical protein
MVLVGFALIEESVVELYKICADYGFARLEHKLLDKLKATSQVQDSCRLIVAEILEQREDGAGDDGGEQSRACECSTVGKIYLEASQGTAVVFEQEYLWFVGFGADLERCGGL